MESDHRLRWPDFVWKLNALSLACLLGRFRMVRLLVQRFGADPSAKSVGKTPKQYCLPSNKCGNNTVERCACSNPLTQGFAFHTCRFHAKIRTFLDTVIAKNTTEEAEKAVAAQLAKGPGRQPGGPRRAVALKLLRKRVPKWKRPYSYLAHASPPASPMSKAHVDTSPGQAPSETPHCSASMESRCVPCTPRVHFQFDEQGHPATSPERLAAPHEPTEPKPTSTAHHDPHDATIEAHRGPSAAASDDDAALETSQAPPSTPRFPDDGAHPLESDVEPDDVGKHVYWYDLSRAAGVDKATARALRGLTAMSSPSRQRQPNRRCKRPDKFRYGMCAPPGAYWC